MAVPFSDLQSASPSSVIELFVLQLNQAQHGTSETYRFHAGVNAKNNGGITWNGNLYTSMPLDADGFEYSGNGQLPRPKLRVSNIFGTISAILLTLPNGLEGAKVTRVRTLARYIDAVNFTGNENPFGTPDPTAEFPREIYFIDRKSNETRDFVEFELAAAFDLQGIRAPKRQCVANICQWEYRSDECGYTDDIYYKADDTLTENQSEDVCGKRVSSCERRFAQFIREGSVTDGSNIMIVNTTSRIQGGANGHPVSGFGIPDDTIVSSVTNSTTLVLSKAATASTQLTVDGTVSTSTRRITVTNSSGLSIGQSITGQHLLSDTTISAISGTQVTLNQRPATYKRTGTNLAYNGNLVLINTNGLTTGMIVFGSNNIESVITNVSSSTIQLQNAILLGPNAELDLYFIVPNPSQSSYTATASSVYKFRSDTSNLRFGSFPGVGQFR